jgi:hypothetical protein
MEKTPARTKMCKHQSAGEGRAARKPLISSMNTTNQIPKQQKKLKQ